ncbi:LPXTG cell wall anchor domain-containing protein [Microbacterium sp. NPDC057944]|uniref:DUF7933 domain-containing protein n=1 Tax=Microbacterium sp. NPDC057944 TaxID=3346286 RepID=UPI0036DD6D14
MIPKKAMRTSAAAAVAFLALAGAALVPTAAQAAPPTPAAPADPSLVFEETFENVTGANVVGLANYTGVDGATYTASPFWLSAAACNGFVLQGNTPIPFSGDGAACNVNASNRLVDLATVLGGGNADNRAVAAYTEANGSAADTLLAQSIDSGIELTEGRFYVASIDTAEVNCGIGAVQSTLDFGLSLPNGEIMIAGNPARACSSPTVQTINGFAIRSGQFYSGGFRAEESSSAELLVRNRATSGGGNDFAYDNLRLFDATPSIYKAFDQETVEVGQPVTMYLTIVNTSELSEKSGWSFTDVLPEGMTIADEPNVDSSCSAEIDAPAAGSEVVVDAGSLATGETSCQIAVDVVLGAGGDYTNVIEGASGLNGEPSASIRALVPSLSLTKSVNPAQVTKAGQEVVYTFVVLNDGELPLHDVEVSDPGPVGGTGTFGDIDCGEVTELAVDESLTCTATYVAGAGDLTGKPLTNIASATGVSPGGVTVDAGATADLTTVVPQPATTPPPAPVAGKLAATGGDIPWGYGVTAGVLLLVGAGVLLVSRKRTA